MGRVNSAPNTRADERSLLIALFLLGLLSRLPFTSQILYHWDSVNFVFALDRFDVSVDQPHIPGYPLYVLLGRAVRGLIPDPNTALIAIALVSTGLSVVALYLLGKAMFSRTTGLVAALALATSPLFWFYGEIALPHSLDTLMVIAMAWLLYRVRQGEQRLLMPAAIVMAVAGGLRPQTQVFLMPLALFAAWGASRRALLPALALMIAVDLAWLIPLLDSAGGLSRYVSIFNAFSGRFNASTAVYAAGLSGITRNLTKIGTYTLYGWGAAAVSTAVYAITRLPTLPRLLKSRRAWFLLFWMAPSLGYYTLVHMGQQGLVFVYLPALILAGAESVHRLLGARSRAMWALVGAGIIAQAAVFVFVPTYPLGESSIKLLTWDTLRIHDAYYLERLAQVRAQFPAERAIVVGAQWRHLQYYLSGYPLIRFDLIDTSDLEAGQSAGNNETLKVFAPSDLTGRADGDPAYLIVFDDDLLPFFDAPEEAKLTTSGTVRVTYVEVRSGEKVYVDADSFGLMPVSSTR